jgi:hypothetical protein
MNPEPYSDGPYLALQSVKTIILVFNADSNFYVSSLTFSQNLPCKVTLDKEHILEHLLNIIYDKKERIEFVNPPQIEEYPMKNTRGGLCGYECTIL